MCLVVCGLEAAQQVVAGRRELGRRAGGDLVLIAPAVGEDRREALRSGKREQALGARAACRARRGSGRPASSVIGRNVESEVPGRLAARGVDEPELGAVEEQSDRDLRRRAAAARTLPRGLACQPGRRRRSAVEIVRRAAGRFSEHHPRVVRVVGSGSRTA